jgi:hypothetical protein
VSETVCEFRFVTRAPCHTPPDHSVHRGLWTGPEPNHEFQPDRVIGRPMTDAAIIAALRSELKRCQEQP